MALRSTDVLVEDDLSGLPPSPEGVTFGRQARNFSATPFGSIFQAPAFPRELIIPRSEWSERIKEKESLKANLSDIWFQRGLKALNQARTNYCWCYAVVTAMMVMRAKEGQPVVQLSAAAAAAQIKNFRNIGGWGGEALDWIAEHGVPSLEFYPNATIDRRYVTPEMKANALLHRAAEWWDIRPRTFDEKATCMLLGFPVPSGYNWWSHEVCGFDLVEIERGAYGSREMNSWDVTYGDRGLVVLRESKANGDDMLALRASTLAAA